MIQIHQLLVTRTDNQPNVQFPDGLADRITIHMTGNRGVGANAEAHARWMYVNAPYSWHVTVDDVEAWQSLPWDMQGRHAGDGSGGGNVESIGIEIAMHQGIDQEQAYENAAWLVATLRALGHGAAGVVQHNYWTGKDCPELIRHEAGKWEWFLGRVAYYETEEDGMSQEQFEMLLLAIASGSEETYSLPGQPEDGQLMPREERLRRAIYRVGQIAAGEKRSALDVAWSAVQTGGGSGGIVPGTRLTVEVLP